MIGTLRRFKVLFLVLATLVIGGIALAQYAPGSNYMGQGGNNWHIGGTLTVESGGVVITADGGGLAVGIGAYPPATCTAGEIYIDTAEGTDTNCTTTSDNSLCLCVAANTWAELDNN